MKKIKILFLVILFSSISFAYAEDEVIIPEIIPPIIEETAPEPILIENLTIRDGDTIIFSGAVSLPVSGMVDLYDNTGAPHSINTQSVLSVLNNADILSTDFSISNLEYYSSFNSLYLKCITGTATNEKCDNWQYTVNNSYPGISMDQNILSGGENIYVYFGPQNRVSLNANEITTADFLTVTAEKYNYEDNIWENRTGITVGLTQPNPDNPWSPTEVKTGIVDANGQVIFSEISVGSYNVGIQQDFYFPTAALTVTEPVVITSSGGGRGYTLPTFNVPDALDYLVSMQNSDGSFGEGDLYTDWASIALVAGNVSTNIQTNILNYMSAHNTVSSILTENERHAMALLALGQNPYSWNGKDYISPIINSFDGIQFGDTALINDDIFALIPLASSGYTSDDNIISKDIQFIISKQKPNGSWEESVDMTSASIQALSQFSEVQDVSHALERAELYLSNTQTSNGGWENVYATSWVLQASSALGTSSTKNNKNGSDYLASNQVADGGVLPNTENSQNRIWATSYAIPAVLGKTWNSLFHSFSKPTPIQTSVQTPAQIDPIIPTNPINTIKTAQASNIKKTEIQPIKILETKEEPVKNLTAIAEKSDSKIPSSRVLIVTMLVGVIILAYVSRHI